MKIQNKLPIYYCEISYINDVINRLSLELNDEYSLYLLHPDLNASNFNLIDVIKSDNNYKIAIHVGNEKRFDSTYYELFDIVFRFYLTENCDYNKIFPINIGYNSSGKSEVKPKLGLELSKREYDVFFIGNGQLRGNFRNSISKLKNVSNIMFTKGFRQGLEIDEYYEKLSNSKICLAPSGLSPETFRYTEGFASGCIVITEAKVNSWYYEDSPAIFVDNWSMVNDEFINKILASDVDNFYKKNIAYYNSKLSPNANAEYILKQVKK